MSSPKDSAAITLNRDELDIVLIKAISVAMHSILLETIKTEGAPATKLVGLQRLIATDERVMDAIVHAGHLVSNALTEVGEFYSHTSEYGIAKKIAEMDLEKDLK